MFGRRKDAATARGPDQPPASHTPSLLSEAAARQAAAGGSPAEMIRLGVLLRRHGRPDEAAEWFRDAADAGNVDGMTNLAIYLMARGRNAEAAQWLGRTGAPLGKTLAKRLLDGAECYTERSS